MTRLTKELREKIIQNAVEKSKLELGYEKIKEERKVILLDAYAEHMGGKENSDAFNKKAKSINSQIEKLSKSCGKTVDGGIVKSQRVSVNFGGEVYSSNVGVDLYHLKDPACWSGRIHIEKISDLTGRFQKTQNKVAKIQSQVADLKSQVSGVVYSVTTVKKLKEIWPECEELIPANVEKGKSTAMISTQT